MGETYILFGIQIMLSVFEVWLYYQVVFGTIIQKWKLRKRKLCLIWGNIILMGVILGINREILFFSHGIFAVCLFLVTVITWTIQRKQFLLIVGITGIYFSFIALLDFLFAFVSIPVIGEAFSQKVYFRGIASEKVIIYFCSRMVAAIVVFVAGRKSGNIRENSLEFRNMFLGMCVVSCFLVRNYQMVLARMAFGINELEGKDNTVSLLITVIISSFVGILFVKYKLVEKENSFLSLKEEMERQKYEELSVALERNKELIHDTKNQFLALKDYERRGEYERLHQYLAEISGEYIQLNPQIYTGVRILDLLLEQKKICAEKKDIIFEFQARPFIRIHLSDREICSLFGNLLDNAIEACDKVVGEMKEIHINVESRKRMIFIEIRNTNKEEPKKKLGEFISSKRNSDMHGYGLKSVKRIVDKYEGTISFRTEGDWFIVSLSLFGIE